jgi:hypothetical protein
MYGWFCLVGFAEIYEISAYAGMTTEKRTTNGKRKTIVNYQLSIVNYFAP